MILSPKKLSWTVYITVPRWNFAHIWKFLEKWCLCLYKEGNGKICLSCWL